MVAGGAREMKRTSLCALVVLACLALWRALIGPGAAVAPNQVLRAVQAEGESATGVDVTPPSTRADAASQRADAVGEDRPSEPTPAWRVSGRFTTGDVGVPGVGFALAMRRGFTLEGELLGRFELTTDASGAFALALEPPQTSVCFDVLVADDATRRFVRERPVLAPLGDPAPTLEVRVILADARIAGRVVGPDAEPVAGALVSTEFEAQRTLADGRFSLRARSRRTWLTASAVGMCRVTHVVDDLAVGATLELELRLGPGATVTGTVTDELGRPLAGATVDSTHETDAALTDALGRYALAHIDLTEAARRVALLVRCDGYLPVNEPLTLDPAAQEISRDFTLARGADVAGRVVDPAGRPVIGAEVWLEWREGAWGRVTARSDDAGAFLLAGCRLGPVRFGARKRGFSDEPRSGELALCAPLEIQLAPSRPVRGVARATNGAPVEGVKISARCRGEYVGEYATVDASGGFHLRDMPSGPLRLEAFGGGFQRAVVDVPAGWTDGVEVLLAPAGRLAGRVVDAVTEAPLESFTVRLSWPTVGFEGQPLGGVDSRWVTPGKSFHDTEGRWSTGEDDELVPGQFALVEVEAPGYSSLQVQPVAVGEYRAGEWPLVHALTRPVDAEVVVRWAPGDAPVEGAVVFASRSQYPLEGERTWQAVTGAAGVALLRDVSPGEVYLRVERAGGATYHAGRHGVSPSGARLALTLPAGHAVDVAVRDAEGRAVPGAQVVLLGDDPDTARFAPVLATADDAGIARFRDVAPGAWIAGRHVGRHTGPTHDLVVALQVARDAAPTGPVRATLAPPGKVALRLLFEGERAVPDGTLVLVKSEGDVIQRAGEAHGGAVSIDGLTPGAYRISCAFWSDEDEATVRLGREFDVADRPGGAQVVVSTDR